MGIRVGWVVIGLVRYIAKRFEGIWRRGESDEPIEGNPTQPPHMYVSETGPSGNTTRIGFSQSLRDLYETTNFTCYCSDGQSEFIVCL